MTVEERADAADEASSDHSEASPTPDAVHQAEPEVPADTNADQSSDVGQEAKPEAPAVSDAEQSAEAAGQGGGAADKGPSEEPQNARETQDPPERKGPRLVNRSVVGVIFHIGDAPRDFDSIGLILEPGARIMVEHGKDARPATVAISTQTKKVDPRRLRRVIRRITENQPAPDGSDRREQEAETFCLQKIREYKLPMKLVRAEYARGSSRCTFYFASEERVDFRELVRDLARQLQTRVEMRQIGVRDQAKLVGGLGVCGRELCCCSWIHRFAPVSIRMAKDQGLALNPQKVSGVCGRLLCCLTYEQDTYKAARTGLPKVGKRIKTPLGEGRVRDVDVLQGKVRVQLESGMKEFTREELCGGCGGDKPCAGGHQPASAGPQQGEPSGRGAERTPQGRGRPESNAQQASSESGGAPSPGQPGESGAGSEAGDARPSSRRRRRGGRGGSGARPEAGQAEQRTDADAARPESTPQASGEGPALGPDGTPIKKKRRRRRRRKPKDGGGTPSSGGSSE